MIQWASLSGSHRKAKFLGHIIRLLWGCLPQDSSWPSSVSVTPWLKPSVVPLGRSLVMDLQGPLLQTHVQALLSPEAAPGFGDSGSPDSGGGFGRGLCLAGMGINNYDDVPQHLCFSFPGTSTWCFLCSAEKPCKRRWGTRCI